MYLHGLFLCEKDIHLIVNIYSFRSNAGTLFRHYIYSTVVQYVFDPVAVYMVKADTARAAKEVTVATNIDVLI
jgi:hypothetical protein